MALGEKIVYRKLGLPVSLFQQWQAYAEANPAWVFDDLIAQLMRQHFLEAEAMLEAVTAQEEVLQYQIDQKKKLNPSQGGPPG